MGRSNLSLPHERRKAKLQGTKLQLRVRLAETKQHLQAVEAELKAMKPPPKPGGLK